MIKNAHRTSASSQLRRIFCSLFVVAAAVSLVAAVASSNAVGQRIGGDAVNIANKVAPWVVEHTAYGQQAEFFVVLAERADVRPAANLPTKTEKGRFVYQTLLEKARATQGPILQWLRKRKIEHHSFYIVNAILVKGTRQIAEALAARPDVARIEGNPLIHNNLPQPEPVTEAPSKPQAPKAIEPGITYTHAPDVWGLGFTGEGIVVASADTGQRWTHNALKPHYRGWNGVVANHDYNWHDSIHDSVGNPCGNDSPFPCDDFFHGTHTTGTAIGDDGMGNQIGMAPGAKWIGCRNMDVGNGTPASDCSTVVDPPSFYAASYPVGALQTGTDTIASFSSRGPVTIDGSGRIKPDITAPGTGTRSASNASDNAYTTASGTSMATPHISGAMALLWSARPELKHNISFSRTDMDSAAHFISSTQCGTAGPPNNVYGWGRVDALAD